jgi:hypothetical protein
MMRFYDAKDAADLARVEGILKKGGIEYSLAAATGGTAQEIQVAEEDVPRAQELIEGTAKR